MDAPRSPLPPSSRAWRGWTRPVRSGTIDATFRALTLPERQLPDGIETARVLDEPIRLLTRPAHQFAAACAVTPAELAGHRIWMSGTVTGTEWTAYYDELAAAFGLTIDPTGPHFGTEPLLDVIADSSVLATTAYDELPSTTRHRSTRTH